MSEFLRILHLEDDPDYSELVKGMLEEEGMQIGLALVDNMTDFREAVAKSAFDIILADYSLPTCTGLEALQTARQIRPDVPFLLVSGTIGEKAAIESLRQGATDYVLKNWPERLVPAIRRAVQENQERHQRLLAETALTRKENYFRALTENSVDILTILNPEGVFQYNSPSIKHVLGYEPEELVGRNAFELVHPDDLTGARQGFAEALQNPERRVTREFRCRRQDGSWCHLEAVGQNRLKDVQIDGIVLNSRDISERKQAEARLRLQSAALESAANAIFITDGMGNVTWVNQAFTQLTGYSAQEVIGKNPRLLKSGRHDPAFYRNLWEDILAGRVWQAEMVNRRKDGSLYTEESTITPVRDERGAITHFIAVKQDVTARKELESQLRQMQKMEAIGQLASGVAHDFNNLLLVIGGNAELALTATEPLSDELRTCLNQITAASKRAGNLTRQLLVFGRKQAMQFQKLNLNDVISDLIKMLNRIIGEDVRLQCSFHKELPFVQGDVGMMEQVIVNLVVNARDAMPRGGQLEISTEGTRVDEKHARAHPESRAGEFVSIRVRDSGMGIAPEDLPRIFEPFFTTKQPGKGTGLGLATVYGIVKQHQGWVEVVSEVGTGTTFRIFLPTVASPAGADQSPQAEPRPRGGNEDILVVEDDSMLRTVTRRFLEAYGYHVREAASGQEALDICHTPGVKPDLLLTDIVLPDDLTGRELAQRLQAERPQLKVVFTTGYSQYLAGKDTAFVHRNQRHFLQKPYSANVLLHKVRQCLDEK
ncbi:MAG TPA: PAS domain S-box protein [Candidatus Limnocylindrales bacterium]|jgi:PAS domain S-box-containing protein|nr:PAS domain S-box protein [Candidatus Limnocylindrales bacterium]